MAVGREEAEEDRDIAQKNYTLQSFLFSNEREGEEFLEVI